MIRRFLFSAALAAAVTLAAPLLCLAQERDLVGFYRCEGTNPNGTRYRGLVEIAKNEHTYRVRWIMPRHGSLGVGIIKGDILAVSYFTGGNIGVVLYKIEKGPTLVGEWAMFDADGKVFPETLTRVGTEVHDLRADEQDQVLADAVPSGTTAGGPAGSPGP